MFKNSEEIIRYFSKREVDPQSMSYLHTHAKRYAYLLAEIKRVRDKKNHSTDPITTFDIGPSFFTELYQMKFPEDNLYTLGLNAPENRGGHFPQSITYDEKAHFYYNLNDSQYPERWLNGLPKCDIIIMAEVIEHLYTAPEIILNYVKGLLKPNGYLFLQTPNAAELTKRTKMMFQGKNPYQMIREEADNPGHFREYTKKELLNIAKKSNFKVDTIVMTNYFLYDSSKSAVYKLIRSISLKNFRRYIFMILKKI